MMAGGQVGLRFAQDLHKRVQLEANLSAIQTVGEGGVKARKRGWFFSYRSQPWGAEVGRIN